MPVRSVIFAIVLAAGLAACASASRVMISDPRPPIPVEQVRVYTQPPAGRYVEIALLDARSGEFTYGAQNRNDTVIGKLRAEAARLGANGVLLQEMGQMPSSGGVGIGVGGGSGGRHGGFGGGISVGVSPPKQTARAIAIYLPDAR
ncbi:MAG: hypothetical protein EPO46_10780 [Lysobacter sp.]|nr:MAG: hypothetical protein EPO46_10780 [Lysobacter sp.]